MKRSQISQAKEFFDGIGRQRTFAFKGGHETKKVSARNGGLGTMARPAGFEPTTPWFVVCEPDCVRRVFNNLGATVRIPVETLARNCYRI